MLENQTIAFEVISKKQTYKHIDFFMKQLLFSRFQGSLVKKNHNVGNGAPSPPTRFRLSIRFSSSLI